ncbi:transcriptional regulator [Streptobacillus felis]|uniref:hypothetical protein n=1 Tax=Streptobacillus felis TaxID=1384509 RepID=UPI000833C7A9|nr:hypothetical protein [Streptobacillus felis]
MKNYNKNDLLLKNNYELYEIAKKENIISKYDFEIKRDKLIMNILKNNEYINNIYIDEYSEEGYSYLQNYFENNLRLIEYEKYDFYLEELIIYKEIVTKTFVKIKKSKIVDKNIVLLVNEYRYIYGIFTVNIIEIYDEYYKCELTLIPELNRITSNFNNEKIFYAFIQDSKDLYDIYYDKYKKDVLNDSLYTYIVPIIRYKIMSNIIKIPNLYVKLGIDYIESKFLKENFFFEISNLENNISLNFGSIVKNILVENNYKVNRSFFTKIEYVLNMYDEEIVIKDENLNSRIVKFYDLYIKFIKYYVNKIEYKIKQKIENVIILKNEEDSTNNYYSLECINNLKYFNGKDREYTYILSDLEYFKIIYVKHNVKNNKVTYKLNITAQVIHENNFLTEFNFLNLVIEYLKNNKESIFENSINMFKYLKENKDIEISVSKEYDIKIREEAKLLVKNYFKNIEMKESRDLDDIIVYLSFKSIYSFFDNFKIIDILKKFSNIKLAGKLVHTSSFIEVLKEFIPGKIIDYKKEVNESEIFEIIDDFEKKKSKGNISLEYKYIPLKYDIILSYNNYLSEKIKIISFYENITNFIDKDKNTIFVELNVEKIYQFKENVYNNVKIYLPEKYIELDENELLRTDELGIKDIELDEVINDIVRIFFSFSKKNIIRLCYVKRNEDQLYCSFDELKLCEN